jgi:hypothetical protein
VYPKANGTSTVCTVYSSCWTFYYTYFQSLLFLCLIPLSTFIIFGILTRNNLRNVRQLHQSITRQMTRMVLLQSMTIEKDALRTAQDNMFNTVANLLTYVNYIGGFYIYLFSSKSLRQSLKNLVLNREQTLTVDIKSHFTQNQTGHATTGNKIRPTTTNNI